MSTTETSIDLSESQPVTSGSFFTSKALERLTDPEELIRLLNKTSRLPDTAFEEIVHDIGWRVVLWHMRAGALSGNVKLVTACDIYLRRADTWRQRGPDATTKAQPHAQVFVQAPREIKEEDINSK